MWDDMLDLAPMLILILAVASLFVGIFYYDDKIHTRELQWLKDCMDKHTTIECHAMLCPNG